MIREVGIALYVLGTVMASANDDEAKRVDGLLQQQEQEKSKKTAPTQSFVLGTTELRLDNPTLNATAPSAQPVAAPAQATVSVRQPLNDNAALNFSNEFGSQKNGDTYSINRKEMWAFDWTRSAWNGRAYSESQSSGTDQQFFTSNQTAYGARTGAKVTSTTELSVEMRQENYKQPGTVSERDIYQTQLSQKIGNLPFTLELTPGLENEVAPNGDSFSQSTRLNNAFLWQANPNTKVTFGSGLNAKDYADSTREESVQYYSQFDTAVVKDLTFSLRSDFQDLTRNGAGIPSYQEQKVNIQIGPRFKLPEDFSASLDMRYGVSQQNGSSSGTSEQALALSIQGRF